MTKDAFGHEVSFGTVIRVGKMRKDGKYPVTSIFQSTGARINSIMTKAQLDAHVSRPDVQVYGYAKPATPVHHVGKKTSAQLDREVADALADMIK